MVCYGKLNYGLNYAIPLLNAVHSVRLRDPGQGHPYARVRPAQPESFYHSH